MEIKELVILIKETKKNKKEAERLYSKLWLNGDFNSKTYWSHPTKYSHIQPYLKTIQENTEKLMHYIQDLEDGYDQ